MQSDEIADWQVGLTSRQRNWGFMLCFLYLRNVKGFPWNHKRVYRICPELELNLRIKPKKRLYTGRSLSHLRCQEQLTGHGLWILCMTNCLMAAAFGLSM